MLLGWFLHVIPLPHTSRSRSHQASKHAISFLQQMAAAVTITTPGATVVHGHDGPPSGEQTCVLQAMVPTAPTLHLHWADNHVDATVICPLSHYIAITADCPLPCLPLLVGQWAMCWGCPFLHPRQDDLFMVCWNGFLIYDSKSSHQLLIYSTQAWGMIWNNANSSLSVLGKLSLKQRLKEYVQN